MQGCLSRGIMIFYYSNQSVCADIFIRSLRFVLKENIEQFSFSCSKPNQSVDLVIIDGEGIHPQQLKKIVSFHEGCPAIFISNRKFKFLDVAAVVPYCTPVHEIADICRLFLGEKAIKENTFFTMVEELLLKGLEQGQSNKEMARGYDLPLSTVKYYLRNLYKKMGVNNRTQAALKLHETVL